MGGDILEERPREFKRAGQESEARPNRRRLSFAKSASCAKRPFSAGTARRFRPRNLLSRLGKT
jgi:hypothetical protein